MLLEVIDSLANEYDDLQAGSVLQRTARKVVVGDRYIWGQLMAGVLASVPIAILYFLGQRFVVQGLAAGSVKG